MRLTKENLPLWECCWKESKYKDIAVELEYGDMSVWHYNSNNISDDMVSQRHIYRYNGNYVEYRTLLGKICISEDGKLLWVDIKIKYRNKYYTIIYNNIHGENNLDISTQTTSQHSDISLWNNKGKYNYGKIIKVHDLDLDIVEKVINFDIKDYGDSVKYAMDCIKDIFNKNKTA